MTVENWNVELSYSHRGMLLCMYTFELSKIKVKVDSWKFNNEFDGERELSAKEIKSY